MQAPPARRMLPHKAVRRLARLGAHPHLVERPGAAAAEHAAEEARVASGQHLGIALGQHRVVRQRMVAREPGGKLHAPRAAGHDVHPLLELLHERIGRAMQQRHQLRAVRPRRLHRLALAAARPLVGRDPGDGLHVVLRFRRQGAPAGEPVAHPLRAGIVGGRRQAEIAELVGELAQELGRFRQRLHRVERIEQPALRRGARHELGDALGALAAARARSDHAGLEPALLPDHPREEFERQVVARAPTPRSSGTRIRADRHPRAEAWRPAAWRRSAPPARRLRVVSSHAASAGGASGCAGSASAGDVASSSSAMMAMRAMRLNDEDGVAVRPKNSSVAARREARSRRLMRRVDML